MACYRAATVEDANNLSVFAERTFRDTYSTSNPQEEVDLYCRSHFSDSLQKADILNSKRIILLAEGLDSQLIGYAQIHLEELTKTIKSERIAELNRLYVSTNYHGKGVAQELLQLVIRTVSANESEWLWLGVWENNERAISYYQKSGFKEVGEQTFLFGSDPQRDLVLAIQL